MSGSGRTSELDELVVPRFISYLDAGADLQWREKQYKWDNYRYEQSFKDTRGPSCDVSASVDTQFLIAPVEQGSTEAPQYTKKNKRYHDG